MKIWIDGDAAPGKIKDIIFKAAIRTKTHVIIVANHHMVVPPSPYIKKWIVAAGFDAADNKIIEHIQPNDLVITSDIPLANSAIEHQGIALNPRGELYTENNIKQSLAIRNMNESLRSSGLLSGGSDKLSQAEIRRFSNHLDKLLASPRL